MVSQSLEIPNFKLSSCIGWDFTSLSHFELSFYKKKLFTLSLGKSFGGISNVYLARRKGKGSTSSGGKSEDGDEENIVAIRLYPLDKSRIALDALVVSYLGAVSLPLLGS